MMQLDLVYGIPRSRNNDPQTSHKAAERAETFAVTHRNRIVSALRLEGPGTARDLAKRTGLDFVAVNRRMVEIKRMGLAYPTNEVRDGCHVWRIFE